MALKIIFMGTPEFSVPTLRAIAGAGHHIVAAYSQPPRPAGRGMAEKKQAVHQVADELKIEVRTPRSFKEPSEQAAFAALEADAAIVIAYGLLLPKSILTATRLGCYNLHASKLPRWRGAAPIQRAIMAGDTDTAVMVMHMDEGLDTGPVCLAQTIPIGTEMTAGELHDVLSARGAALTVAALESLEASALSETAQALDGVTYAAKIAKAETRIDFARPAREVHNHIRGLSPFPGAWFEAASGSGPLERIKALRSTLVAGAGEPGTVLEFDDGLTIACAEGAVCLGEVQRAGKRPMSASEFARGFTLPKGTRLR